MSDRSVAPLKTAAKIEEWFGSCLTVLHVVPTFDAMEVHNGEWFDRVSIIYFRPHDTIVEDIREMAVKAGVREDREESSSLPENRQRQFSSRPPHLGPS